MTDLERRQLRNCRIEAVYFQDKPLRDVMDRETRNINDPNLFNDSTHMIVTAVSDELGWRDSEDAW